MRGYRGHEADPIEPEPQQMGAKDAEDLLLVFCYVTHVYVFEQPGIIGLDRTEVNSDWHGSLSGNMA
jgi:hypothetical protein